MEMQLFFEWKWKCKINENANGFWMYWFLNENINGMVLEM